jgi:signal peptidase I
MIILYGMENSKTGRTVLFAFLTAVLLKLFVFDFMIAEGNSMMPAIKPGTILIVGKIAYGFKLPWSEHYLIRWAMPKTGDVVVFHTPLGVTAVKRCAGIGEDLTFIALGDNRVVSFDSASYGPVPVARIIGKVLKAKSNNVLSIAP